MFKELISQTGFTTEVANEYFKNNIPLNSFQGDISYATTLRALFGKKLEGTENAIHLRHFNINLRRNDIELVTKEYMKYDIVTYHNTLNIVDFSNLTMDENTELSKLKEAMKEFPKYSELENVEALFKKNFRVACYIHEEYRSTVLFVMNLDIKKYHLLQCATLGILPWYADDDGISDKDRELLYSLREKSSEKYLQIVEERVKEYNFREMFIRQKLKGIETIGERQVLEQLKSSVKTLEADIKSFMDRIAERTTSIRDSQTRIMDIELRMNNTDTEESSELMKYFLVNSKLGLGNVYDSEITYTVKDYIRYFDEAQAKKYIGNNGSYFYRYCNKQTPVGTLSVDDVKRVMTAIFIDQELKIRTCSAYRMNLSRCRINPVGGYSFSSEFDRCLPNPHIDGYECIGNYAQAFAEAFRAGNYIGVIENTISSAISLNLADAPVMEKFINYIFGYKNDNYPTNKEKCIELPNGMTVNIKEAAEWLKENENE